MPLFLGERAGLDQEGLQQEHMLLPQPPPSLASQEACGAVPAACGSSGGGMNIIVVMQSIVNTIIEFYCLYYNIENTFTVVFIWGAAKL